LLAAQGILLRLLLDGLRRVPKLVRQKVEAATNLEHLEACIVKAAKIDSLNDLRL
jgi:hypothetical protein